MPIQKDGTFKPINIAFPYIVPDPGRKRYEKHIPNCGLGVSTQRELDQLMIASKGAEGIRIMYKMPKTVIEALGDLKIMGKDEFLARNYNLDYVNAELGEGWMDKWA